MKNNIIKAAAISCIALGIAACSSDDTASTDSYELRLSSGLTVQDVSRAGTAVQSDAFANGESVDIFIYENATTATKTYGSNGLLTYTAGENNALTPTATQYWPESGNGVNIYGFYPSGKVTDAKSTTAVDFTVQTDQSADADYKASDLMYGVPTSNPVSRTSSAVNVQFSHLLSKVTVALVAGDGKPDLEGAEVTLLSVKPTVSLTPSTGKIGETASGTAKDIKVFTASESTLSGSCIVPPQTLANEFVKVTLKDGGTLYGSLSSGAPSLTSGNAYTYTITVNLTGLELTGSITEWQANSGSGTASMK